MVMLVEDVEGNMDREGTSEKVEEEETEVMTVREALPLSISSDNNFNHTVDICTVNGVLKYRTTSK